MGYLERQESLPRAPESLFPSGLLWATRLPSLSRQRHRGNVLLQGRGWGAARHIHSKALAFEIHLNHKNNTCFGEAQGILMTQAV